MSEYDEIMDGLNEVLDIETYKSDIGIDLMLALAEVKTLTEEIKRLKAELHNCRNELCATNAANTAKHTTARVTDADGGKNNVSK